MVLIYENFSCLNKLCQIININTYLSYLFLISENKSNLNMNFTYFYHTHIFTFEISEDIYSKIKNEIENLSSKIGNNFEKFIIKYLKYKKIIKEYNKLYKYTLFAPITDENGINNENNKNNENSKNKVKNKNNDKNNNLKNKSLKDIIEEHESLFIKKISQDISFYLGLTTENNKYIENLLKQDILNIVENKELIDEFIQENKVTIDLKDTLNKLFIILKENNNNNKMNLNEEEISGNISQVEIISLNGIHQFYEDENEIEEGSMMVDEIDEGDNDINDSLLDINLIEKIRTQNENIKKRDNKENIKSNEISQNNSQIDDENNFKIDYLVDEVKDNIRYSLTLITLKLYYKFFLSMISKILISASHKLLSENIVKEE